MRTAIYARVSTTDKGQDNENQILDMRTWCAGNAHEIIEIYQDRVSGSGHKKRPEFERMMKDAQDHKFEQLLFWSLDRFSRQGVLSTLLHLQALDDAGICWKSKSEAYLDSCGPFKDAVLAILAAIAKQERLRTSERVKAGLDKAKSRGRRGGRPPVERDPELLRKIHGLRVQSYSVVQIAKQVGISKSQVHRIIQAG